MGTVEANCNPGAQNLICHGAGATPLSGFAMEDVAVRGCHYSSAFSFATYSSLPVSCCLRFQSEDAAPAFDATAYAVTSSSNFALTVWFS